VTSTVLENIRKIKSAELCTGCGTCAGICPNSAIKMIVNSKGVYIPQIDNSKCITCGKCLSICPGYSVDFKGLNVEIFGSEPDNPLIGNYLNCYLTHSTNNDIRYNSTSGGLITQLLIFALENGFIDGALVTKMGDTHPLKPQPFIARTVTEIIKASKSKYCPVPLNLMLREILRTKDNEKFAIVGLPCHIQGIRKAERINNILKKKVVLHFGLFCNHTPTFLATEFIFRQIGFSKNDISKLDYRGEGWPGGMSINLKNGNKIFVPHFSPIYWGVAFNLFFFPTYCTLCSDKLCELADISYGDAWLPELANDKLGTSLIITRTKRGEKILHKAFDVGVVYLKKVSIDTVLQSQGICAVKRRRKALMHLFTLFGKEVPSINRELPNPKFSDYLQAIFFHLLNNMFSRIYLWKLTKFCSLIIGNSPLVKHKYPHFEICGD